MSTIRDKRFYQEAVKNLPAAGPIADRARETWRKAFPALHQHLEQTGNLDNAARLAEANYRDHYSSLVENGASSDQADESASDAYLNLASLPKQLSASAQQGPVREFHQLMRKGLAKKHPPATPGTTSSETPPR